MEQGTKTKMSAVLHHLVWFHGRMFRLHLFWLQEWFFFPLDVSLWNGRHTPSSVTPHLTTFNVLLSAGVIQYVCPDFLNILWCAAMLGKENSGIQCGVMSIDPWTESNSQKTYIWKRAVWLEICQVLWPLIVLVVNFSTSVGEKSTHQVFLWGRIHECCLLSESLSCPHVHSLPVLLHLTKPFTSEECIFRLWMLPLLYHTKQTVVTY